MNILAATAVLITSQWYGTVWTPQDVYSAAETAVAEMSVGTAVAEIGDYTCIVSTGSLSAAEPYCIHVEQHAGDVNFALVQSLNREMMRLLENTGQIDPAR